MISAAGQSFPRQLHAGTKSFSLSQVGVVLAIGAAVSSERNWVCSASRDSSLTPAIAQMSMKPMSAH